MAQPRGLLTNATFATSVPNLFLPIYVGIETALPCLVSFLLLVGRTAEAQHKPREELRSLKRKFPRWRFSDLLAFGRYRFELVWTTSLLLLRVLAWILQRFATGGFRIGMSWLGAISAVDVRLASQKSAVRSLRTRNGACPEERLLDQLTLDICAALDVYNRAETVYMERLEAYISQLTARTTPAMPFETVEAEHRLQVLIELNVHGWSTFDEALAKVPDLTQTEYDRWKKRLFLLIYLNNLLLDPSESSFVALQHKFGSIERYVEVDFAVASALKRCLDDEIFPARTILQHIQRILYVDVPRTRSPRYQCTAANPTHREDAAKPLLDLLETLVLDPALDKVDLTSLCMLFYDAYEAHKRLARVEGELWEGIVAFVVARRNLRRAVSERRGVRGA